MNEADLYSLNRRNLEFLNIDAKITNMKKKIKELKKNVKLNKDKYIAIRNFTQEAKDNYNKILRPLKIKSTVEAGDIEFRIQNLIGKNKKNKEKAENQNFIDEEELVGSDYSDEDKYEDTNNNIHINTQTEIKTNIQLNLIENGNKNSINKTDQKYKIKFNDNGKFNSK